MPNLPYIAIQDGEEADNLLFNTRFLALHNLLNGGLDAANLADGAVTSAKLATDAVATAKLAPNSVTAAKIEVQQAFQTPSFTNGWMDYDAVHESGGYMKDSLGFVHLKGLIKNGSLPAQVFNIPAGYRPAKVQHFSCASSNGYASLRIDPNGEVKAETGGNAWFSLGGVTYKGSV